MAESQAVKHELIREHWNQYYLALTSSRPLRAEIADELRRAFFAGATAAAKLFAEPITEPALIRRWIELGQEIERFPLEF